MNFKSTILLLLCVSMVLSCALPAGAVQTLTGPTQSSNMGDYEYTFDRWANPINSYLVANADGTLTRVEYTDGAVAVEEYDAERNFISGISIQPELPLFGGFYSGQTHNFLVFGQANPGEDDSVEVIRVVRYTKDWQRTGSASLYGANTSTPFMAGSLRFAECSGYLYIRTAHEMYTSSDGKRHQANLMINVRLSDMTITDSFWKVMNISHGYVSHSFNQFIAVDGDDLLAVDHGDAHPRAVVLMRYNAPAGQDSFMKGIVENYMLRYVKTVDVLNLIGQTGQNDTGAAVGGFEVSGSAYLIVGNTIQQQAGGDLFGQRNIFITATSKTDFSEAGTTLRFLTNYTQGDNVDVSNPHFVKLSDDRFILLWTETTDDGQTLRYCFVDGLGQMEGEIYSAPGVLSDCKPVVQGDQLIWYATQASGPAFFTIDLKTPQTVSHDHIYTYEYDAYPAYDYNGALISSCAVCGEPGAEVVIPALKNAQYYTLYRTVQEPSCTQDGYGYFSWNDSHKYDIIEYVFGAPIPALGHDWTQSTCTQPEICKVCGQTGAAALGHSYGQTVIHKPTPTEQGYSEHSCTLCGHRETFDYVSYVGATLTGTVTSYLTDGAVTVELLKDGQVLQTQTVSGKAAQYRFENLEPGTYTLRLSKDNHGSAAYELDLQGEEMSWNAQLCPTGDVTGDGVVNIKDFQRLLRHVNKTSLLADYELLCGDVTGDGVCNIKDFQRLLRHINKTNPLF